MVFMSAIIRLLRPGQWLKNTFVFMPLVFSQHLFHTDFYSRALLAFAAFCLASSSIYIINDIVDREADRLHPKKKMRPIASGEVSVLAGVLIAIILLTTSILLTLLLSSTFLGIILLYIVLQLFYSFKLKQIVIVDVFVIAMGFMLRVLGGAIAINVLISHWIVLTTLFLSLFLAISKRRSELIMIQSLNIVTKRKVLTEYDVNFLNQILIITATGMAISYSLYTMADRTIAMFNSEYLIFTTVFVLFGIFRYLFLVLNKGEGENPTAILMKDIPTAVNFLLWITACIIIIYFH